MRDLNTAVESRKRTPMRYLPFSGRHHATRVLTSNTGFTVGIRMRRISPTEGHVADMNARPPNPTTSGQHVRITLDPSALIVHAIGYFWVDNEQNGVRALPDGGWEFVVVQLVRDCTPVQYDRVLLRVDSSGNVSVRGREVWEKLEGACV